jgi:hypothetical protein
MATMRHKSLHQNYGKGAPLALSLGIRDAAETTPMPSRFMVKASALPSFVVIVDQQTGRTVEVALCHYRGVREALASLFGD